MSILTEVKTFIKETHALYSMRKWHRQNSDKLIEYINAVNDCGECQAHISQKFHPNFMCEKHSQRFGEIIEPLPPEDNDG